MNEAVVQCPVCHDSKVSFVAPYRNQNRVFSNMSLMSCSVCDMYFASPMPLEKDLAEFNASYFDSAHGGQSVDPTSTAFFTALAKLRAVFLSQYVEANKTIINRVLEIGPGPGYFAEHWKSLYKDVAYYAIETDTSCYDSLGSKGVAILDNQAYDAFGEKFDMVIISHVLEHVTDPYGFLGFATKSLRENGILFVDVPCSDWKHKPLDEPHLLFFSKKPMEHLLKKMGFGNIQLKYFGQTIQELNSKSVLSSRLASLRFRLIKLGFASFFSGGNAIGTSSLTTIEQAVIKPFKANVESSEPSWWLRGFAVKNSN